MISGLPAQAFDSLEGLLAEVRQRREREVTIESAPAPQGSAPSGLWLHGHRSDRIIVSSGVSETHRKHIILHEIGHMLMGHSDDCGAGSAQGAPGGVPVSHLSGDLVDFVLHRTRYGTRDETEAELFASMVGMRLAQRGPGTTGKAAARLARSYRRR